MRSRWILEADVRAVRKNKSFMFVQRSYTQPITIESFLLLLKIYLLLSKMQGL